MKRLLALLLVFTLALPTALAETPSYAPEVTALKTALAALREQYGFTLTTSGVFSPEITTTTDGAQVVFRPYTFLPVDRLGEYIAVITGETVTITWSHDIAALTAAPDCPIWGHAQVQTYFDQGIGHRDFWVETYITAEQERTESPDARDGLAYTWVPLDKQDIPKDQLHQLAAAALADIYAIPSAGLDEMYFAVESGYMQCADGTAYWLLRSGDENNFFTLLINKETNQVFRTTQYSGGLG